MVIIYKQLQLQETNPNTNNLYTIIVLRNYSHKTLTKSFANILVSSSSFRTTGTDIPDPLSPLFPIVHRLWQVFRATSRILT